MHACIHVYIFPSTEFFFIHNVFVLHNLHSCLSTRIGLNYHKILDFRQRGQIFPNTETCLFFTDFVFPYLFKRLSIHPHWLEWSQFQFWTFWTTGQISQILFFPSPKMLFFSTFVYPPALVWMVARRLFWMSKKGVKFTYHGCFSSIDFNVFTFWIVVCLYPFAVDLNDWE
jgi:hypothetical protein